jgi:hypothetical protein
MPVMEHDLLVYLVLGFPDRVFDLGSGVDANGG